MTLSNRLQSIDNIRGNEDFVFQMKNRLKGSKFLHHDILMPKFIKKRKPISRFHQRGIFQLSRKKTEQLRSFLFFPAQYSWSKSVRFNLDNMLNMHICSTFAIIFFVFHPFILHFI